jgi:hypothetical protein
MKKIISLIILTLTFALHSNAQMNEYAQEGEFGITAGLAHYFGDLNNRNQINRPKIALGAFVRKQFGNYTAVRLSAHYALLGYSDIYSDNQYQIRRNLSFNTNIFEIALQGDFNFFKFIPTDPAHSFTPYATLGIGFFSYDPYAFYGNEKVYLRPLNTEGEGFYKGRKSYGSMAMCFPIGFGLKYAINDKVNLSFEVTHRFTTTDYIDDVSTTYIGVDKFPSPNGGKSIAAIMQDRSVEVGTPIGIEGRQRGFSKQKDQYIIAEFGVSFNITSYRCPTAKP